jgi:hypothetical protein
MADDRKADPATDPPTPSATARRIVRADDRANVRHRHADRPGASLADRSRYPIAARQSNIAPAVMLPPSCARPVRPAKSHVPRPRSSPRCQVRRSNLATPTPTGRPSPALPR